MMCRLLDEGEKNENFWDDKFLYDLVPVLLFSLTSINNLPLYSK